MVDESKVDSTFTIRKKLHNLDDFKNVSDDKLKDHGDRITALEEKAQQSGDNTSELLQSMYQKIMKEFQEVQDELQHKFSLQVAENKRLQSHLTNQKNEMHAMHKRLVSLEERVKNVELTIGEDES